MTPLQQARERLSTFEAKVVEALIVRRKAEAEMKACDAAQTIARNRATKVQALIERPGSVHISSVAGIGPSYIGREATVDILSRGRNAKARAIELVASGEIKVQLRGEGTILSLRGLTQRTRLVDKAALRRIAVMRRKKDAADAAARAANNALIAAVRREYEAGTKIDAAVIAEYVGTTVALTAKSQAARFSIDWNFASDDRIGETRRDLTAHLAHVKSKSKDDCPCRPCLSARNQARWAADEAERKAARERSAA